jgi:hypothetical protein
MFSHRIMVGVTAVIEVLLSKGYVLTCFVFCFVFLFARAYFIIGFWALA